MEPCDKAGEIAEIKTTVNDLRHIVKGNGQPGLQTLITQILVSQQTMSDSVSKMATSISSLAKFQTEIETEKRTEIRTRKTIQWLVTAVISLVGIIVTIILKT